MKIAQHIKQSLDAADRGELDQALLSACIAVDGTAKKMFPEEPWVGERFRSFINEHLDIIELMFGGLNLQETVFPFKDAKGHIGIRFADIVYEKFRCNLAHGDELPDGYGVSVQIAKGHQQFLVDIQNQSMTLPSKRDLCVRLGMRPRASKRRSEDRQQSLSLHRPNQHLCG